MWRSFQMMWQAFDKSDTVVLPRWNLSSLVVYRCSREECWLCFSLPLSHAIPIPPSPHPPYDFYNLSLSTTHGSCLPLGGFWSEMRMLRPFNIWRITTSDPMAESAFHSCWSLENLAVSASSIHFDPKPINRCFKMIMIFHTLPYMCMRMWSALFGLSVL